MHVELEQIEGRRFAIRARGLEVIVDDTVEAGGPGDGFRPTELLLGALAACMAGTMMNFANDQQIPIDGISMTLDDEVSKAPTRIGKVAVSMTVDTDADERQVASLSRVASACKVHNTLRSVTDVDVTFEAR
jgi:uncharacterized OsmC-like protein